MVSYELAVVLAPTVEDEGLQTQIDAISRRVTALGGTVNKADVWGRRQLAYPIKKFHEGHYVLFDLQMPPNAVASLERDLRISETVIRHLVVRAES
jgi:small subunit ribosomal protein S6